MSSVDSFQIRVDVGYLVVIQLRVHKNRDDDGCNQEPAFEFEMHAFWYFQSESHFRESLEGSVSAVSKPIFATEISEYSLFSMLEICKIEWPSTGQ